ncbi:MAG: cysteine-rich CWC family protein [Pseudomonadota bacterium]
MTNDLLKVCPRCGGSFECNKVSISHCQCRTVPLSAEQSDYISKRYDKCLCAACLVALQSEYNVRKSD